MLEAKFFVTRFGNIIGFDIKGHSGYAESGADIVCAAVSSAAYMTANTITDILGVSADIFVDESIGQMKFEIKEKDIALCNDIFNGFKSHLLMLEEIYSQNIKVSYMEV